MIFMKPTKLVSAFVVAATTTAASFSAPATASAEEIYFIRGFANVWSAGITQMANKLRARGCNAQAVSNGQWNGIARDIISRNKSGKVSYPIIVLGHSTGGQEAPLMANTLGAAGVSTALVIGVDPGFAPPKPFNQGAKRVVNFWIAGSSRGNPYRAGSGFDGTIENINIRSFTNADHTAIDDDPGVQSRIVDLAASVAGC
jgi:predicted alpha/beta-hydrolase family hydrolase